MDYLVETLFALVALVGHTALWVSLVNRLNSFAIPHGVQRWVNRICLLSCAVIPLVIASWLLWIACDFPGDFIFDYIDPESPVFPFVDYAVAGYMGLCQLVALWAMVVWIARRARKDAGEFFVRANHTHYVDVAQQCGENLAGNLKTGVCSRIPGNQLFQFAVQTKALTLPQLPAALDGFSIAHLSDLHFAGHIRRAYHDEVVRQTNLLDADLIAITGDIIDRRHCLEWFAATLGKLRARHGVYFILGNHDGRRRCAPGDIRRALVDLGLVDLGGRHAVVEHNGARILLAGNELPWHKAPPANSELPFAPDDRQSLSVLLSHSPDQFFWAQRAGYRLMLAGHVHGGQIRPPLVGPLLSPSRYGVRFASGVFYQRPTLLHVSRGVSNMIPLRFFCPPEIAKLVLHAKPLVTLSMGKNVGEWH